MPIIVVEPDSQKPLGIMTEESVLDELERMQD